MRAVEAWLRASGLHAGPLFRGFKRNQELRDHELTDKAVALIVKKYAGMAGLDPANFAGHSLRRGFATSAAQHDVDALSIVRQTRPKENPLNKMYHPHG